MVTNSFNVDYKIISKALASKVKNVLPNWISPQQTVYGKHRFIVEGGRLIADIIETSLFSGMQSVDLKRDAIKISGIYFSYYINLMHQKNYCQVITNIHGILKLWRMRYFSIEGNIEVFKTLVISKLVYLTLPTVIPNHIADEVAKIQKSFIWHNSSFKLKHKQ